jgi:hypothetical protein
MNKAKARAACTVPVAWDAVSSRSRTELGRGHYRNASTELECWWLMVMAAACWGLAGEWGHCRTEDRGRFASFVLRSEDREDGGKKEGLLHVSERISVILKVDQICAPKTFASWCGRPVTASARARLKR